MVQISATVEQRPVVVLDLVQLGIGKELRNRDGPASGANVIFWGRYLSADTTSWGRVLFLHAG
jgi:hypothetical protein